MKLEKVKVPHTLGGSSYILSLYINSVKEVVSHLEVELYEPLIYFIFFFWKQRKRDFKSLL